MQVYPTPQTNRQIIHQTVDFYISLLELSSTLCGPPSPFEDAFPLVDSALLVTQQSLVTRRGDRAMDFFIHFRMEHQAMMWWVRFDELTVASFTIPASTNALLREWSPSGIFVLRALRTSLSQTTQNQHLSLVPSPFTISTLGRAPAQELALCSSSGVVVAGAVLYRCVTRRCGRVFAPGERCRRHEMFAE
ncbi:SCP domain-containing protein [Mycena chlorophos]|uniref:SCP domain-containing protein n=1 Tax=Mycena chlorophos TaxID=658473 RepID=A0A8H6VR02_MYCCL|nr:SCP domain-containing protein [Mycena chlorophos]